MADLTTAQFERVKSLYCSMPGAEPPSYVDGEMMWGDVEGTEEWAFCESIVRMVDKAVGHAVNALASAHNLV
jgi:hypothetical protein